MTANRRATSPRARGRSPAARLLEAADVEVLSDFERLENALGYPAVAATRLGNLDAVFARQNSNSLGEGQIFHLHQKSEGVSPRLAAKAVEGLSFRIHVKRWRLFIVKGTQTFVIAA